MLTVDDFGRIRRAHRDGMSIRELSRPIRHSYDHDDSVRLPKSDPNRDPSKQ